MLRTVSLIFAVGLVACGGDDGDNGNDDPCPAQTDISIEGQRFVPSCVTIAVGDTVTWTNNDTEDHTATDADGPPYEFRSPNLAPDDTFDYLFDTAGTYDGLCEYHTNMTFEVRVE